MKILFRLSFIILVLFSFSYSQFGRMERKSLGVPYFHVVIPGYPTEMLDSVRIDVIVKIPNDAVQFLKKGNVFEAQYEISISIQDKDENQVVAKITQRTVTSEKFKETISEKTFELLKQSFVLKPSEYKCIVELMDLDTHKSGRQSISLDLSRFGEEVAVSDILLIDYNNPTEDFPKGIPKIPPQITDADSLFQFYYEARVPEGEFSLTSRTISVKDELLNEETSQHVGSSRVIKDILVHERPNTTDNKIKLQLLLMYENQESEASIIIESRWHGLTSHVSNVEDAIDQVRYIATSEEIKKMTKAKRANKEELLKEFWDHRDPTPSTPENELMDEYYRRVSYANEKFGTWQNGWKTPMGMIFILFGPPDDIEINLHARDGRSYQRWQYYLINRSFLFVDFNGFGDYELVEPYSSPYGTRRY